MCCPPRTDRSPVQYGPGLTGIDHLPSAQHAWWLVCSDVRNMWAAAPPLGCLPPQKTCLNIFSGGADELQPPAPSVEHWCSDSGSKRARVVSELFCPGLSAESVGRRYLHQTVVGQILTQLSVALTPSHQ